MKPRAAGILGMIGAAVVIVLCAALIATPPFSIVGALGIVGGGILFAIAATLTVRKSWRKSSWPEVRVHIMDQQSLPQHLVASAFSFGIAWSIYGTWQLIAGDSDGWVSIVLGTLSAVVALLVLAWILKKARPK
jgi:hypothetical protein